MANEFIVDSKEFNEALVQYAAASKKDFADITNHVMSDVCLRASQFAPRSSKDKIDADIERMKETKQWYALISKMISGGGQKIHLRRKAVGAEANVTWIDPATGQTRFGRKTVGYDRAITSDSKRADKKRLANKIIKRRKATVKSFVAVFGWLAARFDFKKVTRIGGKNFDKIVTKMAKPENIEALFVLPFKSNRRWPVANNAEQVDKKVSIAKKLLDAAFAYKAKDMLVYAYDKMGLTAKKFSAKEAREAINVANIAGAGL